VLRRLRLGQHVAAVVLCRSGVILAHVCVLLIVYGVIFFVYYLLSLCPAGRTEITRQKKVEEVGGREINETKANHVHDKEANEQPTSSSGNSVYSKQNWRSCCRPWAYPKRTWRRQMTANKKAKRQPVGKTLRGLVDLHRKTARNKWR
jgi:hypothetical protein